MKKTILALSVAASLGLMAGASVAAPSVKVNGVGTVAVIPYFSAQGSNVTQIAITNTDMVNGKAVKVRFRGAEWSDDVFDFQVFLSPGDVFTGAVTNNGNNIAHFETADASCTLPTTVNQDFPTFRSANPTTGTLEGYIEIITMADIPAGSVVGVVGSAAAGVNLYTATKHVGGVAPCKTANSASQKAVTGLIEDSFIVPVAGTNVLGGSGQDVTWMVAPTTGITAWARIIDTTSVKAYGVPATAVDFAATNKAYFRQANEAVAPARDASALTSDRIFFNADVAAPGLPTELTGIAANRGTPITALYQFDLPDLSTDIEGAASAVTARDLLTAALQKNAVATEYSTLASVSGATDIVLNQPTRRYYYNYHPKAFVTGDVQGTNFSRTVGSGYYVIKGDDDGAVTSPYMALTVGNRIGLGNLTQTLPTGATATPAIFFDREEQFQAQTTDIVISPTPPAAGYSLSLMGEASVVSFNRGSGATSTGALGAKLTMNDITIVGGYSTGWALLSTWAKNGRAVGTDGMLPIIGFSAQNVAGANNYGTTLPLRYFGATGGIAQ